MIVNIFLIFNLFVYSFFFIVFMALGNCKCKVFLYIINLDEEILMRVFFASVNVVYPRNDLLGNISIDQLRYINFEKGY